MQNFAFENAFLKTGEPVKLTCGNIYRDEELINITWTANFPLDDEEEISLFYGDIANDRSESRPNDFIRIDEYSPGYKEITVTALRTRDHFLNFVCEVHSRNGVLQEHYRQRSVNFRIVDIGQHRLSVSTEEASYVFGEPLTAVCESAGSDPRPDLSVKVGGKYNLAIDGVDIENVENANGTSVRMKIFAVSKDMVEANDGQLPVECRALITGRTIDKKIVYLPRKWTPNVKYEYIFFNTYASGSLLRTSIWGASKEIIDVVNERTGGPDPFTITPIERLNMYSSDTKSPADVINVLGSMGFKMSYEVPLGQEDWFKFERIVN